LAHRLPPASGSARTRPQLQQPEIRLRREAREEIRRLIELLDASDEYVTTELEDDDDREEGGDSEPSLGNLDRITDQEKSWRPVGGADLDAELDTSDDEPALGSLDHHHSQDQWASGDRRSLEQDDAEIGS
jgi:hypothetical protein